MMSVDVFCCGTLMLCAALQVSHGQQQIPVHDTTTTVKGDHQTTSSTHTGDVPHNAPCFVDDIFVALREAVGNDGELTNSSLANFGLCTVSDSSSSVLLELSRETNRNRPEVLHPVGEQSLKDVLIGAKSGSNISVTPLLLLSGERGTDTRHVSGSSPASSQTSSFLCELKRFLGDILPEDHPVSPPLQLDSLQSLPPLTLGLSSSETLLAGLINSSALTIFSFSSWSRFQVHHGELALSPALLEELGQRLEQTVVQIMEVIREEEMGHRATERLGRLRELSVFPKKEPPAGESQYRAFLLLKALQTVARMYDVQRGLRATRADPNNPARGNICGLKSLTVSLEKHLVGPNTANINNCQGSCAFPLVNPKNHGVLLNSHIESGNTDERAPCCVPVSYDALEVVDLDEHGMTYVSIKTDVVAKECGCC
ncbi:muellerian-inhibiting factor isoform X3 [Larimichthys crocea]|uniref:muellerian-inhibiting factor isoform X3 n=1 Tax=Larimichthys crocea TaxID=215358 RepID=UPI000F5F940A|nr:muellerian-inhibiting factor isoform X3 [Larimichthys crocea]